VIETFGRKSGLMITCLPASAGWLVIAFSPNIWTLYAGRFIMGFGLSVQSIGVPMFISEISPTEVRGTLISSFQVSFTLGVCLAYGAGIFLDWTMLALVGAILPIIMVVCMFFVAESPYWLMRRKGLPHAEVALRSYRGPHCDLTHELHEIFTATSTSDSKVGLKDLFKPDTLKPLTIATLVLNGQVFCGLLVVLFYTGQIFQSAGTTLDPLVSALIVAAVQTAFTIVGSLTVEKMGRKLLLLISAAVMGVTLAALGVFFKYVELYGQEIASEQLGWLPLTSLIVFLSLGLLSASDQCLL